MRLSRAYPLLATGVAATAAVLATVSGISNANASEAHPTIKAARPVSDTVNGAARTSGKPVNGAARTSGKPVNGRLGAIISTGMDASKVSEWVIYGVPVKDKYTPLTSFGSN